MAFKNWQARALEAEAEVEKLKAELALKEPLYSRRKLEASNQGMWHFLKTLDEAYPDLVLSIHGLRPIKEMLPIWSGEQTTWESHITRESSADNGPSVANGP